MLNDDLWFARGGFIGAYRQEEDEHEEEIVEGIVDQTDDNTNDDEEQEEVAVLVLLLKDENENITKMSDIGEKSEGASHHQSGDNGVVEQSDIAVKTFGNIATSDRVDRRPEERIADKEVHAGAMSGNQSAEEAPEVAEAVGHRFEKGIVNDSEG